MFSALSDVSFQLYYILALALFIAFHLSLRIAGIQLTVFHPRLFSSLSLFHMNSSGRDKYARTTYTALRAVPTTFFAKLLALSSLLCLAQLSALPIAPLSFPPQMACRERSVAFTNEYSHWVHLFLQASFDSKRSFHLNVLQ